MKINLYVFTSGGEKKKKAVGGGGEGAGELAQDKICGSRRGRKRKRKEGNNKKGTTRRDNSPKLLRLPLAHNQGAKNEKKKGAASTAR